MAELKSATQHMKNWDRLTPEQRYGVIRSGYLQKLQNPNLTEAQYIRLLGEAVQEANKYKGTYKGSLHLSAAEYSAKFGAMKGTPEGEAILAARTTPKPAHVMRYPTVVQKGPVQQETAKG